MSIYVTEDMNVLPLVGAPLARRRAEIRTNAGRRTSSPCVVLEGVVAWGRTRGLGITGAWDLTL